MVKEQILDVICKSQISPLSQWCHPTISLSPLLLLPSVFPASGSCPVNQLCTPGGSSIGASASVTVLLMNIQGWFLLGLTGWISSSPRDSQESSPTPQFKIISSSALSLLYGPALTCIHDYWKNHSFDYVDLCWQRMSLLFIWHSEINSQQKCCF